MARSSSTRRVQRAAAVCFAALWLGCNAMIGLHEGGEFCTPMTEQTCYTGPEGTLGVGRCKAGVKQCDADGLDYGPCEGEVTPMPETCVSIGAGPEDEDCDGLADEEGAGCVCGDGTVARSETCDDGNPIDGDGCDNNCTPTGCGNGIVTAGEQCDDGGTADTDGCSSTCQVQEVTAVNAGDLHTCALLKGGHVKCWGVNDRGQLGLGNILDRGDEPDEMGKYLPAVDLGTGEAATVLAVGTYHTCALLNGGRIKCWGFNDYGELGLGDFGNRGDDLNEMGANLPKVDLGLLGVAEGLVAGGGHTCALLMGGIVKCWGFNGAGRLGLGDTLPRGSNKADMGDFLPAVDLGIGKVVVALAAGYGHTCALIDGGGVKCWGENGSGQLGLGDTLSRGDNIGEMSDALPAVDLGVGAAAVALAAGSNHTCALLNGGGVKCWGDNSAGQLGLGDTMPRGDNSAEMGDSLPAVDLGVGATAVALAAGGAHTCARLDGGSVKCWGFNISGQLGLGDTNPRGIATDQMGDKLPAVDLGAGVTPVALAAGNDYTCALLNGGSVKCWGFNDSGQLGLGDTGDRGDEANEMGDDLPAVKLFSDVW